MKNNIDHLIDFYIESIEENYEEVKKNSKKLI
jgi:hypothetical protein